GLAKIMSLSCLVFMMLPRDYKRLRPWGFLLSAVLVIASGSRTGILITVTLSACYLMCQVLRTRVTLLLPIVITVPLACLCFAYWLGYDVGMGALLNRDITLTGRDVLWAVV